MSSEHQTRRLIDEIALAFETEWTLSRSAQWLRDHYAKCPCDELLAYLVAADSELARSHGAERSGLYYSSLFPDKRDVIDAALAEVVHHSEFGHGRSQVPDSPVALGAHFFPSLPCAFGKYRILRCIGSGGMAAVFEAEFQNQNVALKLPYRQYQGASTFSERFQKEIRLLSSLAHPNIVPILETGTIDGLSYYTMPLIDGEGLNEKCTLHRFAALSPKESANYVLQATQAIASSHAQGVLHRDIKPSNILVDRRDHVWVVDFGLATIADSNHSLTRDGQLLGTPTWMPPEQACGDYARVDERSDVYSLGATLYTLLTGRAPFTGATTGDLLLSIQRQELIPPRHLYRHVPHALHNIVLKCMEKKPAERYPSAAALATDLQAYLAGQRVTARPRSLPIRCWRWCRLYPRWTATAAMLLVILTVLSVSTLAFRHIANLQNQIAQIAREQRDNAMRSEEQQRQLRSQAESAKLEADDSASYGQAQQLRSAFAAVDAQLRTRHFGYSTDIQQFPSRVSLDTEWYIRQNYQRPRELRAFCTGNWGHYDVALDQHKKLIATAGREGDVAIWDMQTEQLVKYCHYAQRDPDKGFAWIRWRYHAGKTLGFNPSAQPLFFSSVAWTNKGTLLVAGLDGALVEHHVGTDEPRAIYRGDHPMYFVRSDPKRDQYLVADEHGNCFLLDTDGQVLAKADLQTPPTYVGYSQVYDAWIYAGVGGELVYLDQSLSEMGRLSTDGPIHDVRSGGEDSSTILIVSAGKPPSLYRVVHRNNQLSFELQKMLAIQGNLEAPEFCQAVFDKHGRLVAMDEKGDMTVWDSSFERAFSVFQLTATRDIRHPYPAERDSYDWLERRARCFLLAGDAGTITLDCVGTLREFDTSELNAPPGWKTLTSKVGPSARLAADPIAAGGVWALDKTGVLRYVDLVTDSVLAERINAHTGGHADLQVHSNADVFTAGNDQAIRVWRFQNGTIQLQRELSHRRPLISVAVHEGQDLAASVDVDGNLQLFDLEIGAIRHSFPFPPTSDPVPVHTGRLAFSHSGKFLLAFTQAQDCKLIDVQHMTVASASHTSVSGAGGIDVVFSPAPATEHRFLVSSLGTAGNEVELQPHAPNQTVLAAGDQRTSVDFIIPEDRQRVIRLCSDGDIVFCSPEHFVPLTTIKSPTPEPSSLAITPGDSSLIVASADGTLHAWVAEPHVLKAHPGKTLNCRLIPVVTSEKLLYMRPSSLEGFQAIQDRQGHMTATFVAGGPSSKSQLNRLYILRKNREEWSLSPLEFEGDQAGPCEHASLYMNPDKRMCAMIRQGQISIGDYDGRVLLANETDDVWTSEVLQADGNAGFSPFPIYASNGALKSILHLDFEFQRWLAHHRDRDSAKWTRSTVIGNLGARTSRVRDSKGTTHMITRHLRGLNSSPPHKYVRVTASDEFQYEEAQGESLFVNRAGQVFSYESRSGYLWLKKPAGGWDRLGQLPFPVVRPLLPTLDHEDQMWWASCTGRTLIVVTCDLSELQPNQELPWRVYRGQLDRNFSKTNSCLCNRNHAGVLEILIGNNDQAINAIVEATLSK